MGLARIFACAVVGALVPTALVLYFLLAPAGTASAEVRACEAAQNFVAKSLEQGGKGKKLSFLACDQNKEMKLKTGDWQVLGDVEVGSDASDITKESYVVRLKLASDGKDTLEMLSLR